MEKKKMITVTIDGAEYAYPYGTPYKNIAADFQDRFSCDILLVNRDGKLCELHKVLDRDCSLKMVTAQAKPGMQTYERSALFLMLKAFYDVAGRENVERITAEYSISNALFILARGNGPSAVGAGGETDAGAGGPGAAHRKALCEHR